MGQQANSGRRASLDEKKRRAEGRQQNDPAIRQIRHREALPGAGGAFGAGAKPKRAGGKGGER